MTDVDKLFEAGQLLYRATTFPLADRDFRLLAEPECSPIAATAFKQGVVATPYTGPGSTGILMDATKTTIFAVFPHDAGTFTSHTDISWDRPGVTIDAKNNMLLYDEEECVSTEYPVYKNDQFRIFVEGMPTVCPVLYPSIEDLWGLQEADVADNEILIQFNAAALVGVAYDDGKGEEFDPVHENYINALAVRDQVFQQYKKDLPVYKFDPLVPIEQREFLELYVEPLQR